MKKFIICTLLIVSGLSIQAFNSPSITAEAYSGSYKWNKVWNNGEIKWVLYYGGHQVYGWQQVNGTWYYIYPSTGYMAHDTFIDGYYVNSDGAWTNPYEWRKVWSNGEMNWVLYYGGKQAYGWHYVNGAWYYIYPSTGYMAHDTFVNGYYVNSDGAWTKDIPNILQKIIEAVPNPEWIFDCGSTFEAEISFLPNQNLKELTKLGWNAPDVNGTVVCIDFSEYFVADDGTVFKAPHQAYDTIYQYNKDGTVKEYPYIGAQ